MNNSNIGVKTMLKWIKDEDGQTVVEATIVVPIVIMVIFVLMYLGFILYQYTVITVVANDTAASIGQIYATPSKDPFVGYTETTTLTKTKLYRNLHNAVAGALGAADTVDGSNQVKGTWFAKYRLMSTRLYKESGDLAVNVDFERRDGAILQRDVVVTVKATYELPFLKFFGIQDTQKEFSGQGRAQCLDLLDYSSFLSLVNTVANDVLEPSADKVVSAIEEFMGQFG